MYLYSIILFFTALLFGGFSIAIYRGKTELIHDYHQTKVTDKAAYGKAFGKALAVIAVTLLLSGVVGLLGEAPLVIAVSLGVLFIGMGIGTFCIFAVQKKYNNGLF